MKMRGDKQARGERDERGSFISVQGGGTGWKVIEFPRVSTSPREVGRVPLWAPRRRTDLVRKAHGRKLSNTLWG